MHVLAFLVRPGSLGLPQLRTSIKVEMRWIRMVNQQKRVEQETSAVVVNVSLSLYRFGPKRVIKNNDIGRDGNTYSLQLHYRQFIVPLIFADLPSLSPFISRNDYSTKIT